MKTLDGVSFDLELHKKTPAGQDLYYVFWSHDEEEFEIVRLEMPVISPEGTVYWYKGGLPSSFGKLNKHFATNDGAIHYILNVLHRDRNRLDARICVFRLKLVPHFLGEGI